MQFNVAVKSDSRGRLKGAYQGKVESDGLHLQRKGRDEVVIARGSDAKHVGANRVEVAMPDGAIVAFAVSRFGIYQSRLAAQLAAFLRGERRDLGDGSEFKLEPLLLIPAVLPFGIMLLTRGGAIW